ncbi:MAG: YhjD/YihY/BrkB family envelope integrity protein [Bradyrhizobium sp.]
MAPLAFPGRLDEVLKCGATFVIGLAISLWSANAAMKSLFDTLNIVYGQEEKRGFIKLNLVALTFTVAAIAFVLVALGAVVAIPVVLNYLYLPNFADLRRWPRSGTCTIGPGPVALVVRGTVSIDPPLI